MQPAPMPMPQTAFRPIVATIVMVLLLYSLFSGDWAAPANHSRRTDLRQLGFPEAPRAQEFPSIHEKVGLRMPAQAKCSDVTLVCGLLPRKYTRLTVRGGAGVRCT